MRPSLLLALALLFGSVALLPLISAPAPSPKKEAGKEAPTGKAAPSASPKGGRPTGKAQAKVEAKTEPQKEVKAEGSKDTKAQSKTAPEAKDAVKADGKAAGKTGKDAYAQIPLGPDGKPRALSLDEVVQLLLQHNSDLRLQRLELLKADTEEKKNDSQYSPIVGLKYQGLRKTDKALGSTIFTGTETTSDTVAASVRKLFSSGTYFEVEASHQRYDTNAGESAAVQGTLLAQLAQPPLYTGALKVVLRQELARNAFGYSQRRLNEIARNKSKIQRETLIYNLSQLIVKTMVDYWSLAIAEEALDTSRVLLQNTQTVRAITARKRALGLAEYFELNQWNALVSQAEAQVRTAEVQRDTARRELLRTLNLPPDMELTGQTQLEEGLPTDLDKDRDLKIAFETRPDLKNIRLQILNAKAALELAKNQRYPSVTIGGSLAHRDFSFEKNSSFREVPSGRYPEYGIEFKVEYPLWDEGTRVDVRNAKVSLRQLDEQDRLLKRRVEDEIREGLDRIRANHEVLEKAKSAEKETAAFYYGLVYRYRQGRFTAVAVKNALDALAQSRQALMQARVNYNISLVRYELARNSVFRKFHIDIDKVIEGTRRADLE